MPPITAAGVSAGAQALSAGVGLAGAMGAFGDNQGPDRDYWGRYWREIDFRQHLLNRQDDFIRRRVADAKAAGVHPVFALGSQGPSGAGWNLPTPMSGSYGKDVTRRVALAQEALSDLSQHAMRAHIQKTEAERDLIRTQADRAGQEVLVRSYPLGEDWQIGPASPAEHWEQYYGEIPAAIEGTKKYVQDWAQSRANRDYRRRTRDLRKRRLRRRKGEWVYYGPQSGFKPGWYQTQ